MTHSKGISWFDDCRIPFVDEKDSDKACNKNHEQGKYDTDFFEGYFKRKGSDIKGRFPANLLVCDDMLNDGVVSKSSVYDNNKGDTNGFHATSRDIIGKRKDVGGFNDKGTNSRYYDIDKWFNNLLESCG